MLCFHGLCTAKPLHYAPVWTLPHGLGSKLLMPALGQSFESYVCHRGRHNGGVVMRVSRDGRKIVKVCKNR